MSALADRLRGIVRPVSSGHRPSHPAASVLDRATAADALEGEWHEVHDQRILVVDRVYRPGHRHGHVVLADALPPSDGPWPGLSLLASASRTTSPPDEADRALFLDLETTGLAGGAGTCAFLVGCAWFDGGVLRTRQLLLSTATAEPALLKSVAQLAIRAGLVVTYNGKSFDLPLIETRFLYHRMQTPFEDVPHLDLLHAARRLWRADGADSASMPGEGSGCRLTTLERTLCGFVREGDVPGFEIPSRYFAYVRTGDARPLRAVFEHNRLDLVTLAILTGRAAQLAAEGPEAARTAREALGLGHLYERAGRVDEALACYERAIDMETGVPDCSRATVLPAALHACAVLCRRQRRHERAVAAWRQLLDLDSCPPALAREAARALAVHHEHRLRDPLTARSLALRSLARAGSRAEHEALQHRLARLERKLAMSESRAVGGEW